MNEKSKQLRVIPVISGGGAPGLSYVLDYFKRLGPKFNLILSDPVLGLSSLFKDSGEKITSTHPKYISRIADKIKNQEVDFILFFGGRGSAILASELTKIINIPIGLIPITVENDLIHCDRAIGFDSATSLVAKSINRPLLSFNSDEKVFILEVAGRDSGILAIEVGLSVGAQSLVFPENPESIDMIAKQVAQFTSKSNEMYCLVLNEGKKPGRSYDLAENLRKAKGLGCRVTIVSALQRQADVSSADKILCAKYVAKCAEYISGGKKNFMVGFTGGKFLCLPLESIVSEEKRPHLGLVRLSKELFL